MPEKQFDVFLSYNAEERPVVEKIAAYLTDSAGFKPWFDQWELIPGEPWVRNLERGLEAASSCAVFVGESGRGPWEEAEVELALRAQVRDRTFRVIPVLLIAAPSAKPDLPAFLAGNTWVDLRGGMSDDDALWRLECGIRGTAPGRGRPSAMNKAGSAAALIGSARGHTVHGTEAAAAPAAEVLRPTAPARVPPEELLAIIRRNGRFWSDFFVHPEIPAQRLENARKRCKIPAEEAVLALLDLTVSGNAKDCLALGATGIHYFWLGDSLSLPYSEFAGLEFRVLSDHLLSKVLAVGPHRKLALGGTTTSVSLVAALLSEIRDRWCGIDGRGPAGTPR